MNTQMKTLMYQRIFNSSICRILLATCLSALCLIALSTQAATITVTNTNDDGAGSLRQAIANANNGDTIHFGVAGTIILTTGELLVDKSITINGPGSDNLTVDGNLASRVFHVSSGVTAAIAGLTITNGTGWADELTNTGGGIYNDHATLALDNCTVSGNYAGYGGGGAHNRSGTLTVTNSTFSGNWAAAPHSVGDGGAVLNDAYDGNATLTVINSTFSGNQSYHFGGGIYNDNGATLTVKNSTFSDNYDFSGDAIFNLGSMTIGSTILNGAYGNLYNYGTVTSLGYNLSSDDGAGLLTAMGDQINTDPMLGPLQDNGGPTFTRAPLTGSPAIDAGKNFTAATRDQRGAGFVRMFDNASTANASGGDGTDIGAYEVQPATPSYVGQIQPPINSDGTSAFNVRRGVVPVKFTLTQGGVATCDLPPATIAVTRTAGGVVGEVNESVYSGNADTGSNFRIDSCQYAYNLNSRALGVGTYRVDLLIDSQVVGNAVFALQ
jgi:Chlamydia polymorphic membrane protein (Chlamydia_PMP) repeat